MPNAASAIVTAAEPIRATFPARARPGYRSAETHEGPRRSSSQCGAGIRPGVLAWLARQPPRRKAGGT